MASLHLAPHGEWNPPAPTGPGFQPCLSPAERAMARVLATLLRRRPQMAGRPQALLALARSGIEASESTPELVERRAQRVSRWALSRAAAEKRARSQD